MQKLVYVSNSRDFTNQNDLNDNRYFKRVNTLLEEGWSVQTALPLNGITIGHLEHVTAEQPITIKPDITETAAVFLLLEKKEDETP